jgi:hypothetical protein
MVHHLCGDGDLNLNTGLDVDDDLLDDLSGGVKVDQTLVNPISTMSATTLSLSLSLPLSLSLQRKNQISSMSQRPQHNACLHNNLSIRTNAL